MTKKKHIARVALASAAKVLSGEIWEHKWDHIPEVKKVGVGKWVVLPRELEKRCPGHTLEEYRDAIARGMHTY